MARSFLTAINLNKNELQNAVIQNLASAPVSPVEGQIYWDTTDHKLYVYNANATAWQLRATDSALLNAQAASYYLSRTNHTGTQLASTISNLAATVQAYTLDQFATAAGDINLGSHKIINVSNGTAAGDAINKAQLDAAIQGITNKNTAEVATGAVLPNTPTYSNGTSGVGATLTAGSNAALVVDGYSVLLGDQVLVKNQASGFQNGLYDVTVVGDGSTAWVLTRNVSMDQSTEFGGSLISVKNNNTTTALQNSLWLSDNSDTVTVGTTVISFSQINSAITIIPGDGINVVGTTVSVIADTGISVSGSGVAIDTAVVVRKYSTDVGDNSSTSYTITHNLGTRDVTVCVYKSASTYDEVECDVLHATTSTITLTFSSAPTSNQYRCVVHA